MFAAFFIACSLILATSPAAAAAAGNGGRNLHAGFYRNSCPQAEIIAADVAENALGRDPSLAASLLRLFFHDCFVNVSLLRV